jgi:hypothetical protein
MTHDLATPGLTDMLTTHRPHEQRLLLPVERTRFARCWRSIRFGALEKLDQAGELAVSGMGDEHQERLEEPGHAH